jgi:hypothetical protein
MGTLVPNCNIMEKWHWWRDQYDIGSCCSCFSILRRFEPSLRCGGNKPDISPLSCDREESPRRGRSQLGCWLVFPCKGGSPEGCIVSPRRGRSPEGCLVVSPCRGRSPEGCSILSPPRGGVACFVVPEGRTASKPRRGRLQRAVAFDAPEGACQRAIGFG